MGSIEGMHTGQVSSPMYNPTIQKGSLVVCLCVSVINCLLVAYTLSSSWSSKEKLGKYYQGVSTMSQIEHPFNQPRESTQS